MGLIRADQARNAAGTGNIDLFKQWAAKAWVTLNGTGTASILDSENIASLVDLGVGSYRFNYIAAMANTGYSQTCSSWTYHATGSNAGNKTGYSIIETYNDSHSLGDIANASASINGDLA